VDLVRVPDNGLQCVASGHIDAIRNAATFWYMGKADGSSGHAPSQTWRLVYLVMFGFVTVASSPNLNNLFWDVYLNGTSAGDRVGRAGISIFSTGKKEDHDDISGNDVFWTPDDEMFTSVGFDPLIGGRGTVQQVSAFLFAEPIP
jgi:hypothetical protein